LDEQGVKYTINPNIVRGLDYYSKTVFEFVSTAIGAQGTVCGGGRYDALIEQLGGASVPAIGFAAGLERLMLLMDNTGIPFPENKTPDLYLAGMNDVTRAKTFSLACELRAKGLCVEIDHMERSVKAQLKYADKLGAVYVGVIGDSELEEGSLNLKRMSDGATQKVAFADIYNYISANK
jgi:histidyl-tRNA synthetase